MQRGGAGLRRPVEPPVLCAPTRGARSLGVYADGGLAKPDISRGWDVDGELDYQSDAPARAVSTAE